MKIVFMGTPDFAVSSLEMLVENGYEVAAVYSQPDKPKGRGHKMQATPVKEVALKYNIPVYQPQTLRDEEVQKQLAALQPDLIIVVAYGKLLPQEVLDIPKYGCVNVHGSILPKYRGAAPIQWSVLNGDKVTGVTTMYMAAGLDSGDIISVKETKIGEDETSGELFDRLKIIGAELLIETVKALEDGTATRTVQVHEQATLAPMIKKEMAKISWEKTSDEIKNLVRGMNPWPCAFTEYESKKLKIFKVHVVNCNGKPSYMKNIGGELVVFTADSAVIIDELQPENGKRMDGRSFLLGHKITDESHLI